jgi:hypothetical protein
LKASHNYLSECEGTHRKISPMMRIPMNQLLMRNTLGIEQRQQKHV